MMWQMLAKGSHHQRNLASLFTPSLHRSLYVSHQSQIEQMIQFDSNEMVDFSFQMARFDCSS